MESRRRPVVILLGCAGAVVLLSLGLLAGAAIGYLTFRLTRPTSTPAVLSTASPTAQTERASPTATAAPPERQASPTAPTAQPEPPPSPTVPPAVAPQPASTPTATAEPTPSPAVVTVPTDWPEYRDPGFLRFRYPPGWLVVTTPEMPQDNLRSCHCYWIVMSEQMVQNWPVPEAVRDWFNSTIAGELPPGTIWIEILRADSEYAPAVDFGQPSGNAVVGQRYQADVYQLGPLGAEQAYRYVDEQGRPWVIVVKAPDGVGRDNPMMQLALEVLGTIEHR